MIDINPLVSPGYDAMKECAGVPQRCDILFTATPVSRMLTILAMMVIFTISDIISTENQIWKMANKHLKNKLAVSCQGEEGSRDIAHTDMKRWYPLISGVLNPWAEK